MKPPFTSFGLAALLMSIAVPASAAMSLSATESTLAVVNVQRQLQLAGANGDVTAALNAIVSENAATYNYKLVFPPGEYDVSGAGIVFPNPSSVQFTAGSSIQGKMLTTWDVEFRPGARLVYHGAGTAVTVVSTRNAHFQGLTIDMSATGNGAATGLAVQGVWDSEFDGTTVLLGAGAQTGIAIRSSAANQLGFGAFAVTFRGTRVTGVSPSTASKAVSAAAQSDDNVFITHLRFDDGWFESVGTGFDLANVYNSTISNVAMDTFAPNGVGYALRSSASVVIHPAEITGVATGFNFGSGATANSAVTVMTPDMIGGVGISANTWDGVSVIGRNVVSLYGSRDIATYGTALRANYSDSNPPTMQLTARDGGAAQQVLGWSAAGGLTTTTIPTQSLAVPRPTH